MRRASGTADRDERRQGWRVVRHAMGLRRAAFWGGGSLWIVWFVVPLAVGLLLEQLFDALVADGPALWLLAAVAGVEVGRALLLPLLGWTFEPFWATTETALRTNVLAAQLASDPRQRGPAITDPAAGLPLFREDAEHVAQAADQWLNVVATVMGAVIALIVIGRIGVPVALAVGVPLLVAMASGYLLAPLVRRRRQADRAVTAEVTGYLGEVFGAITTVTTAGATPAVLRHLAELCERRKRTAVRDRVAEQLMPAVGATAADLALAAGLLTAALLAADELSAGQVALLASYSMLLAAMPRHWATWLAIRRHADVAVERLRGAVADRDVAHLLAPVPWVHADPPPVASQPVPPPPAPPSLELVSLVAEAPDGTTIGPVDATVPPGGFAVVTGSVGMGKTTLVRAVLGLAPLRTGAVRWDGEEVAPATWMVPPRAAYVAQVPMLFSEALEDNLRLGWDVDEHRLGAVLHAVAAGDLVEQLEDGLATRLGSRGVRLSGGQAHRVAAARALVAGAALVVADDLSAALDAQTEADLLDRLADGTRTLLVVSHRPAVLARADVVIDLTPR